uniref:G domain-containing protein n=1 Tax=Amphimedon queenslandica TaxID=400682 RepID=A0A1X7SDB5_AMPQE
MATASDNIVQSGENDGPNVESGRNDGSDVESGENDGSDVQHVKGPIVNFPPEDEESEEESEEIKQKMEVLRQRGEPIKILVIGQTNSGKSNLINNLIGQTSALVGHGAKSTQLEVKELPGIYEGISLRVFDTIGFGDTEGKSNSTILKEISKHGNFDLVLLCIDIRGKTDGNLKKMLKDMKSALRQVLWKHFVVVFTFTNKFIENDSLSQLPEKERLAAVEEKRTEFKDFIYLCISGRVERNVFDDIPFCFAGGKQQIQFDLLENWLGVLWGAVY